MQQLDFSDFHRPALEADEVRHGLLLSILDRLQGAPGQCGIRAWTLGKPGECAVQTPGYPIVLGNLSPAQCRAFAEAMIGEDYPGVVGVDEAAPAFAKRAEELGARLTEKSQQQILAIAAAPQVPSAPGWPRLANPADFELFRSWITSFIREAIPSDPIPSDQELAAFIKSQRYWLWFYGDKPVAMAAIARRTRCAASINSVFVPSEYRNQGFGAAITAYVARQIFAEGRTAACLYVDVANRASMRCYAKLGFKRVCDSWLIIRGNSPFQPSPS
jgi:predicted GNAT family acetyltransferase